MKEHRLDVTKDYGCLNCKHYQPNPRGYNTPICLYGGCYLPIINPDEENHGETYNEQRTTS